MNEARYTKTINDKLPDPVRYWKISDRFNSGKPDCVYLGPGAKTLWAEYKYDHQAPKTINLPKKLTELQKRELKQLHDDGFATVVIYATQKEGAMITTYPEWERKFSREEFLTRAMTKKALIDWITHQIVV